MDFSLELAAHAVGLPASRLSTWRRSGLVVPSSATSSGSRYEFPDIVALAVLGALRRNHSLQQIRPAWSAILREVRRACLSEQPDGRVLIVRADDALLVPAEDPRLRSCDRMLATIDMAHVVAAIVERLSGGR